MPATMMMKNEVDYKVLPPEQKKTCDCCEFYRYGGCQLVAGKIDRNGTCKQFSARNKEKTGAEELACCSPDMD